MSAPAATDGPLRVLYSFPDTLGKPGIGTTAFHQVEGLRSSGVEVDLHCTAVARWPRGMLEADQTLRLAGARVPHRALGRHRAYRYHDLRVARALRGKAASIDVVHCWPGASLATSREARKLGVPVLREAPNTHTAYAFEAAAREAEAIGVALPADHSHLADPARLERELAEYEQADFLLVPSEFARRTFLERGVPRERLVLHRYGFDPAAFEPDPAFERRFDEAPFTALFVGACEPRKGLHIALRAWLESGAAEHGRFIVCGEFVPGYREALEPLLHHPSVDLRGYAREVAGLMAESHVLVLPSIEEGSALVTYEARACGCVLAVSDAAGARCRHGYDAVVHRFGDTPVLADQLRTLSEDRALLRRMRAASLAGAERLTWEEAGAELAGIYRDCAVRPGGRAVGASAA